MSNPFCPGCTNSHCCLTCSHYTGCLSFIPTQLVSIGCDVPERKGDHISLHIGSWPKINGELVEKCQYWQPQEESCTKSA